jgi:hypothetical protein
MEIQERALKMVPDLCDTIDYAEVQGVLFPRVAVRYSRLECSASQVDFSIACIHQNPHPDRKSCDAGYLLGNGEDT